MRRGKKKEKMHYRNTKNARKKDQDYIEGDESFDEETEEIKLPKKRSAPEKVFEITNAAGEPRLPNAAAPPSGYRTRSAATGDQLSSEYALRQRRNLEEGVNRRVYEEMRSYPHKRFGVRATRVTCRNVRTSLTSGA